MMSQKRNRDGELRLWKDQGIRLPSSKATQSLPLNIDSTLSIPDHVFKKLQMKKEETDILSFSLFGRNSAVDIV